MNNWIISGAFFSLSYLISIWIFVFKGYSILKDIKTYLKKSGEHIDSIHNSVKSVPEEEASLFLKVISVDERVKSTENTGTFLMNQCRALTASLSDLHSNVFNLSANVGAYYKDLSKEFRDSIKK